MARSGSDQHKLEAEPARAHRDRGTFVERSRGASLGVAGKSNEPRSRACLTRDHAQDDGRAVTVQIDGRGGGPERLGELDDRACKACSARSGMDTCDEQT